MTTTLKSEKFTCTCFGELPNIAKGMSMTLGGFGLAEFNKAAAGDWNVKRIWRGKRNMTVQLVRPAVTMKEK